MFKDLNLQACLSAFEDYEGPLSLQKELQPVAEAYHRNITRVTSLALCLPAIASVSLSINGSRAETFFSLWVVGESAGSAPKSE
jgi:hypothetical protein